MERIKNLIVITIPILFLFSCEGTGNKKTNTDTNQFMAMTLDVEISNTNCLAILLAKDGTINRKGNGIADSAEKDFFMGITEEKPFDKLMATVSNDLLSYCGKTSPGCDTTRLTCKVKTSFADNTSETGFEYCVNGNINDLPEPIKEYITNAIKVTDPWYQTQKKLIKKK
jgi:hypothetical protein